MYAVTGITGQIGGVIGHTLIAAKQPVRAVVRDAGKGQAWANRGCEIALATIEDASALAAAFQGAEGVFVLVPRQRLGELSRNAIKKSLGALGPIFSQVSINRQTLIVPSQPIYSRNSK